MIKWTKSDDGFSESRDGRFRIEPVFLGRTRPVWYKLYIDGVQQRLNCSTQSEAKAKAERFPQQGGGCMARERLMDLKHEWGDPRGGAPYCKHCGWSRSFLSYCGQDNANCRAREKASGTHVTFDEEKN